MARVNWSDRALVNVGEIVTYIALHDPRAAIRTRDDLIAAAQSLEVFPNRGRPVGRAMRELMNIWPYVIRYRVEGDNVHILYVRHGAQLPGPTK